MVMILMMIYRCQEVGAEREEVVVHDLFISCIFLRSISKSHIFLWFISSQSNIIASINQYINQYINRPRHERGARSRNTSRSRHGRRGW